jgi:hypothetical protein
MLALIWITLVKLVSSQSGNIWFYTTIAESNKVQSDIQHPYLVAISWLTQSFRIGWAWRWPEWWNCSWQSQKHHSLPKKEIKIPQFNLDIFCLSSCFLWLDTNGALN